MTEALPTPDRSESPTPFLLGDCLVHPALQWIERDGERVRLEPKAMRTLTVLAGRPGEVFTRGELLETVWADTIVGDETLSRIISLLRQVLGDDSRNPRYIETIYKKGYRLLLRPESAEVRESPDVRNAAAGPAPETTEPAMVRRRARWIAPTLLVSVVALGALALQPWRGDEPAGGVVDEAGRTALDATPITTDPGAEFAPAISSDGTRVAFCREATDPRESGPWIRDLATDSLWSVPNAPGPAYLVAWSPDGRRLAYARQGARQEIRVVGVDGTGNRLLLETEIPYAGLDWSPDGTQLAYASFEESDRTHQIRLVDLADGSVRELTAITETLAREFLPAFSPDGEQVAFVRSRRGAAHLYVASRDGESVRKLAGLFGRVTGLDWLPGGRALVLTHMPEDYGVMQRVDLDDGSIEDVPVRSSSASAPSVSPASGRLVFADGVERLGIWTIDPATGEALPSPDLNSTRLDGAPAWSHDGRRLALVSTRSGRPEVWLRDGPEEPLRRLTHFEGPEVTGPRWSYDGRRLAVTPHDGRHFYVEVIDGEGNTRRIDDGVHHHVAMAWSRDSRWLYVMSDRGGSTQTWRMRPDGSEATLVVPTSARVVGEMPGGDELLMMVPSTHEIRVRSLADGREWRLLDEIDTSRWFGLRMQGDQVLYIEHDDEISRLGRFLLPEWRIETLAEIPDRRIFFFTVREDGSRILFEREERSGSDLILVEGVQ